MVAVFLLAATVQLLAWGVVFYPALRPIYHPDPLASPPASVIVCFKNEARKLERCLRGILSQRHPNFEVLAVDDNSTDGSADIVARLSTTDTRLRLIAAGPTRPGKKDALSLGIAAARYEFLLLTDADCRPASPEWLRRMTLPLTNGSEVVLGCSPYRLLTGPLSFWQRYEATYVALQYQGFARWGLPYMGVGRNLAYRKSFFQRAGGVNAHADLPGGDDDLLINANTRSSSTARVVDPSAWTISEPTENWRGYFRQKLRHQSVGMRYSRRDQFLLGGLAVSHGLFFLLGLFLLFTPFALSALLLYGVRALLVWSTLKDPTTTRFMGADAGAMKILLADMLMAPFSVFLAVGTLLPARAW